jgi:DNA-directed RNA polymerase sigma subunit (sigma70/sigma32)
MNTSLAHSTVNNFDDERSYGIMDFDGEFLTDDDNVNESSAQDEIDMNVKLAARDRVLEYIMYELSQFDTKVRDILMLRWGIAFGQAHSNAEIAEIFGVSAQAIKMAQVAATRKLQSVEFFTNLKRIMKGEDLLKECKAVGEDVQYILYEEAMKPAQMIADALANENTMS